MPSSRREKMDPVSAAQSISALILLQMEPFTDGQHLYHLASSATQLHWFDVFLRNIRRVGNNKGRASANTCVAVLPPAQTFNHHVTLWHLEERSDSLSEGERSQMATMELLEISWRQVPGLLFFFFCFSLFLHSFLEVTCCFFSDNFLTLLILPCLDYKNVVPLPI